MQKKNVRLTEHQKFLYYTYGDVGMAKRSSKKYRNKE